VFFFSKISWKYLRHSEHLCFWALAGRTIFSTRCNIYISRLCHDAKPSVRLSVTEVHWRIIDNLGFKFRSHFTAHWPTGAVLLAGESSRAMLASARVSCCVSVREYNAQGMKWAGLCYWRQNINGEGAETSAVLKVAILQVLYGWK